jgi:pimeloyl-ACP methyl ester carboxylesterase
MSVITNCWQRLAARLVQHTSRTMPSTHLTWADAIRSEFGQAKNRPGALAWVAGCNLARYSSRLTELQSRPAHQVLRRFATCSLVLLLVGYALANHACAQTPPRPAFTDAACDLPHISPDIRPRLRCGTVSVPRDYDNPEAGRFKLAVVVIRSERQPALVDPLVYISGGPGSPLTVYTNAQAAHPFAPGRDLILVDQRGIGRSEPDICPDDRRALADGLAAAVIAPGADTQARRRAIFAACRDQAIVRGIDLRDFGTSVTVQDFDTVRQALGVKRWNVFGVSYGTTVAMTLVARYPDTVRSAVLDSVYPPDPVLPLWSTNVADARDAFFASCDTDAGCAAAYPDLAGMYRQTMTRLEQSPLSVSLPAELRDPTRPGLLTPSLFELVIGHLLYYPNFYPGLPRLIASVHDGDATLFASSLASLFAAASDPDTGTGFAANAAVDCRDRPRFHQPLADSADIFDRTSLYDVCESWADLGPPPVIPSDTRVPTLVLAGQFDPNARPSFSRHVAALIGRHAQWIEFRLAGHSVRAFSPCAARIVADFVDRPTQALHTSCADHPPPIPFLPRQQTP